MKSLQNPKYRRLLEELAKARKQANITQKELAAALKKPQSYVSKYEGAERRIDVMELIDICEVLNVDYKRILDKVLKT
ncbi:MAG: helix-turn-helix domain-containing protein [Micavibrio sp.]